MGIGSMVQFTVRVAAFVAVAALLLQVSCMVVPPAVPIETAGGFGCHESVPPTPTAPDSSHICCSGDHSPDALLSANVTPAPLIADGRFLVLPLALHSFASFSADFSASFSPPHKPLALRI
jgi:hypothetical protein